MAIGAGVLVALAAHPAVADPPGPTDFRSEVKSIEPDISGLVVEVVGGDSFLHVVAPDGVAVSIPGYDDAPYARINANGAVEVNQSSEATYLNQDRYARDIDLPPTAGPDATPRWERIAGDGEFTWHDHRIHFMGGDRVDFLAWEVKLEVGGRTVVVQGEMERLAKPSVLPPVGLAVVAAALVGGATIVGRRRPLAPAVAALGGAAIALFVGWQEQRSAPREVAASLVVPVVLPAVGVAAVLAGLAARFAGRQLLAMVGTLAGVAAAGGWVLSRPGVFTHAVLPTDLSSGADRLSTAAVAGMVSAAAVLTVWLVAPALPALDDGEPDEALRPDRPDIGEPAASGSPGAADHEPTAEPARRADERPTSRTDPSGTPPGA